MVGLGFKGLKILYGESFEQTPQAFASSYGSISSVWSNKVSELDLIREVITISRSWFEDQKKIYSATSKIAACCDFIPIAPTMVVGLNKCCREFLQLRMDGCHILEEGEALELGPKIALVETMGLEIGVELVNLEGGIKLRLILSCSRSRMGKERI
jgi:hypothetical protein